MRNRINLTRVLSGSVLLLSPVQVLASSPTIFSVMCTIVQIVDLATPIVVAMALLAFFWGLATYLINFSGDEKDKKKGREIMVYGVLALFVMLSVWGIVNMLQATFGVGSGTIIPPTFEGIPPPTFETKSC